jgi:hypothetical protein
MEEKLNNKRKSQSVKRFIHVEGMNMNMKMEMKL